MFEGLPGANVIALRQMTASESLIRLRLEERKARRLHALNGERQDTLSFGEIAAQHEKFAERVERRAFHRAVADGAPQLNGVIQRLLSSLPISNVNQPIAEIAVSARQDPVVL